MHPADSNACPVPSYVAMACPIAFTELAVQFKLSDKVRDYLWQEPPAGLGLETVADLEWFANSGEDVDKIVAKVGVDDSVRQGSRLKRAWQAVKQASADAIEIKKRGAEAVDLDQLLPEPELDGIRKKFWGRHKFAYPPHLEPSDAVVSRLQREIQKRMLTVRDIAWVRTMAHQLRTDNKRLRVGEGLYIEQGGQAQPVNAPRDAASYIDALTTLMIAYAKAGIHSVPNAPEAEPLGSGSTNFVEFPLDVGMKYVWRADWQSRLIPYAHRYEWLRVRDQAERLRWVELHRNSELSLGKVVEIVFTQRESAWQPPESFSLQSQASGSSTPVGKDAQKGQTVKQPGKEKRVAEVTTDGTRICDGFQKGRCDRGKRCPHAHVCAVVLSNGQICGARGHGANGHDKAAGAGKGSKRR